MLKTVTVYSKTPNVPPLILPIVNYDEVGPFYIKEITGLGPVAAVINSRGYGLLDGEYWTGSKIGKRNIVLTIGINSIATTISMPELRKRLYGYLGTKVPVLLRFSTVENPDVEIDGYVETFEHNIFDKELEVHVSIICPKPYFLSSILKSASGIANNNPTPVSMFYDAQSANGIIFELFRGSSNYTGRILIEYAIEGPPTYRKFEIVTTIDSTHFYILDSNQGIKTVEQRSLSTNLRTKNLLLTMTNESLWPFVAGGTNKVKVTINSSVGMPWFLYYRERFGGL